MKIKELTLFTNQIEKQKQFYKNVLGFNILLDSKEKVTFKTGDGMLSFQFKQSVKPAHFAFNIPSNKVEEALLWLQKRVVILPDGDQQISNFEKWNAKAIYFYDADNNIVEFIARADLNQISSEAFSSKSILAISEIALPTEDIKTVFQSISNIKSIPVFDGDFNRFCALGNHEGLFILINKTVKTWHPTQEVPHTADFIVKGDYNFSFINNEVIPTNRNIVI